MSDNPNYDHWFKQYAPQGISWTVLKKIAVIESNLGMNPRVKAGLMNPQDTYASRSYDGLSWGIMQMIPSTAQQFDTTATAEKLNNPEYSIRLAGLYLNWARAYILTRTQLKETDARFTEYLVKSYNQGVGSVTREINSQKWDVESEAYWSKYKTVYV